jgi:hypothetical protein
MNKLKKLYRDFFGLVEQTTSMSGNPDPSKDVVLSPTDAKDPKKVKAAQDILKTTKGRIHIEEEMVDEAQLVNNITDYRGGVEYVLRDPADAKAVATEIRQWTEKKGFTIVKQDISASGRIGYFYFRLGQDPALESQKIQGYIAQKPEIKHFRFKVRGEREASVEPVAEPKRIIRRNPNINI